MFPSTHLHSQEARERAVKHYYTTEQKMRDMQAQTQHQTISQVLILCLCAVAGAIVVYRSASRPRT